MMKKYWKTITITAVTFLSIGTFYVHSSIAAIELPEFVIENQSGDASLVESLVIDGSFNQNPLYKSLQITVNCTINCVIYEN